MSTANGTMKEATARYSVRRNASAPCLMAR